MAAVAKPAIIFDSPQAFFSHFQKQSELSLSADTPLIIHGIQTLMNIHPNEDREEFWPFETPHRSIFF